MLTGSIIQGKNFSGKKIFLSMPAENPRRKSREYRVPTLTSR